MVRIYKLKPPKNRIRGKAKKSKSVCIIPPWLCLEIWPNVINITALIIFGHGRKQAQRRARKEVEQTAGILGTERRIFFSDREFLNSVTVFDTYKIYLREGFRWHS